MIAIKHSARSSQRHLVRLVSCDRQKPKIVSVRNFLFLLVLAIVSWLLIVGLAFSML